MNKTGENHTRAKQVVILVLCLGSLFVAFISQTNREIFFVANKNPNVQEVSESPLINNPTELKIINYPNKNSSKENNDNDNNNNEMNSIIDSPPNILLFIPDQWRFDWYDKYYDKNLQLNTPNFEYISNNGVRFTHAICASPICAPSRASIASGREYDNHNVNGNFKDLDLKKYPTFYKILQMNGYNVLESGKDDITMGSGVGAHSEFHRNEIGFTHANRCRGKLGTGRGGDDPFKTYLTENNEYDIYLQCLQKDDCCNGNGKTLHISKSYYCPKPWPGPDDAYEDTWIQNGAINLFNNVVISEKKANENNKEYKHKPWFLQLNYAGPHDPIFIRKDMMDSVANREYDAPIMNNEITKEAFTRMKQNYAAEIELLDSYLGDWIDLLKKTNEFENTIICVTSDHGEMLGDFGLYTKFVPWSPSMGIPLACMNKKYNIKSGVVIDAPVTNMDLSQTFIDYSKINNTIYYENKDNIDMLINKMESKSLRGILQGNETQNRDYVLSGFKKWRAVLKQYKNIDGNGMSATLKYICCEDGGGDCKALESHKMEKLENTIAYHGLYNLENDLYETNNLVNDALFQPYIKPLSQLLPKSFCH